MICLSKFHAFMQWLDKWSHTSVAEHYLSKSIDRADFDYREKVLRHKGLL